VKAHYKPNAKLMFELEGGTAKEVFELISSVQEVFGAEDTCGCCNSPNIAFRVRETAKGAKVFKFFELHCLQPGCRARFAFGQSTDMVSLFPKRKDESGQYLPNRGWSKYVPKQEDAA